MSSIKKVSREQLYDSQSESEGEFILPDLEFEIVDKDLEETITSTTQKDFVTSEHLVDEVEETKEEADDEFDFPLFSFGGEVPNETKDTEQDSNNDQERGRTQTITQKISLREPSVEKIIQSRPESYYFQRLTVEQHANFESIAVTYDDILKHSTHRNNFGKVWDLTEYNAKIEIQKSRDNRKKGRPGKKARATKRVARENEKARDKIKKEEKQRELKKLMKKIHHKRGGKKNKKKNGAAGGNTGGKAAAAPAKPKYRTE